MKNAKIWIALIALLAVVGLMVGIYIGTRQQPEEPKSDAGSSASASASDSEAPSGTESQPEFARSFTLIIIHSDGSQKTLIIGTDREFLADALLDEQLIVESDSPGLYNTVDGEQADWNVNKSYWSFLIGEEYAMEGMNTTRITDGATYQLVYTVG